MLQFTKVYNDHKDVILSYFKYKGFNQEVSEELTNDTFLKVSLNLESFDESKAALKTWLIHIAKNVAIDQYRKTDDTKIALEDYMVVIANEAADSITIAKERNFLIKKAIQTLPEKQQTIVDYYFIQDMKYTEIAEQLDIPLSTVKVYVMRSRAALQRELKAVYQM